MHPSDSEGSARPRWWVRFCLGCILKGIVWVRPTEFQITLVLAGVLGALAGLLFVGFLEVLGWVHWILTCSWIRDSVASFAALDGWVRFMTPVVGGVFAGATLMVSRRFLLPGQTTDYMEAVVIRDGVLPVRRSIFQSLSGIFSIASGGSIGREGPVTLFCALLGSLFGRGLKLSRPRLRLLVASGAAAGIAAAYSAPISGALFVAEVVMGTMAMEIFGPLVFASVIATVVVRAFFGLGPLYDSAQIGMVSGGGFVFFAVVLGVVCGFMAPVYVSLLRWAEACFAKWCAPLVIRMAFGGMIVGVLALWYPEVTGNGYSAAQAVLHQAWPVQMVALIVVLKLAATAATFGSGAVGGIVTPTLFTGAGLGYLIGWVFLLVAALPGVNASAFALMGMGMFFAAAARAPFMAILFIFEITLNPQVILPLMLGATVAYFTARGTGDKSLYREALRRKGRWEFDSELHRLCAGAIMKPSPPFVSVEARLDAISKKFLRLCHNDLYVVDAVGRFVGVISIHDIKLFLAHPEHGERIRALDLVRRDIRMVSPDEELAQLFKRFAQYSGERLPVVADDETQHLLGTVTKADAILAFTEMAALKEEA